MRRSDFINEYPRLSQSTLFRQRIAPSGRIRYIELMKGAKIPKVHDVTPTVEAITMALAILKAGK